MLYCRIALAQLVCAAILYSFDLFTCCNFVGEAATLMLLVRLVRRDRKMKTRLGKVIFDVSVRVAVIVSLRGGL
jgi:hypothetical protein